MATTLENALRLVKPGEMVVSLTDILNKLGNKITTEERDQLLIAMLSARREKVQPGDLITTDLMNQVLVDIADLQVRVAKIEVSGNTGIGAVTILEPNPSRTLRIGAPMIINGTNFGKSPKVMLEEAIIMKFEDGSNDRTLLIKAIPNIQNIPQQGRAVSLTVTNETGAGASTTFTLAQPELVIPTGTVKVWRTGTITEKLVGNKSYIFPYRINATATMDEIYILKAKVDAGWPVVVLESASETGKEITSLPIAKGSILVDGTTVDIGVRVTIPVGVVPGDIGKLTVTISSQKNPTKLNRTSDETVLTVDQKPAEPPAIPITPNSVTPPGTLEFPVDGRSVISVPATGLTQDEVDCTFIVTVPADGSYSIQIPLTFLDPQSGAVVTGWAANVIGNAAHRAMTKPTGTFAITISANQAAKAARLKIRLISDADSKVFGEIEQDVKPLTNG